MVRSGHGSGVRFGALARPPTRFACLKQFGAVLWRMEPYYRGLGLATRSVVTVCCAIQLSVFVFDVPLGQFTLSAARVLYQRELYRIVTAAFFHGGLMHILMNMTATVAIGGTLERMMGTAQYALTILWGVMLTGLLHVLASWTLATSLGDQAFVRQPSVGFSGVIFALAVIDSSWATAPTRSVYGIFSVPSKLYPWVLLLIMQVIIPNVSFLGHLSGILVGTFQAHGGLAYLHPSPAFLRELESRGHLERCPAVQAAYVACPADEPPSPDIRSLLRPMGRALYCLVGGVCTVAIAAVRPLVDAIRALAASRPSNDGEPVLPR